MEKVFYKYRGDSEFTEQIITSGKVYLATAHQLNDPFECSLADISQSWMQEQMNLGMQAALAGFFVSAHRAIEGGDSFFGIEPDQVLAVTKKISSTNGLNESYEAFRAFIEGQTGHPPSDCRAMFRKIDGQLVETGIFSMSADPAQALMWAHYGSEHRGICLGFRQVDGSKLANPSHGLPVVYSDTLPSMEGEGLQTSLVMAMDESGRPYTSSLKVSFTDKTFQRVVTTKPSCWAYEQEFRYIEPYSGLCDWPGELVECTFGLRCRDDRRQHYVELLAKNVTNDVFLFEIRAKPGTNALERVPFDPPFVKSRVSDKQKQAPDTDQPIILSEREFAAKMEQYIQQERYGDVIFYVGEALKQAPSGMLLHLKATAHGLAHEHDVAYELYKELADSYPDIAGPYYGMACALQSLGRLDEVVQLLQRANTLDPNDPSIALNLGSFLIRESETFETGIEHLRRADRLGHRRARRMIEEAEAARDER